jgi:hypothetical protein
MHSLGKNGLGSVSFIFSGIQCLLTVNKSSNLRVPQNYGNYCKRKWFIRLPTKILCRTVVSFEFFFFLTCLYECVSRTVCTVLRLTPLQFVRRRVLATPQVYRTCVCCFAQCGSHTEVCAYFSCSAFRNACNCVPPDGCWRIDRSHCQLQSLCATVCYEWKCAFDLRAVQRKPLS